MRRGGECGPSCSSGASLVAFVLLDVPLWLGVLGLSLIGIPLGVGSSRGILKVEEVRPQVLRSAREAVDHATVWLASGADQMVLPLVHREDAGSGHSASRGAEALSDAMLKVASAADSATQRLLIAARANFRLEAITLASLVAIFVAVRIAGLEVGSRAPGFNWPPSSRLASSDSERWPPRFGASCDSQV